MRRLSWLFFALLVSACGGSGEGERRSTQVAESTATRQTAEDLPPEPAVTVELATRNVACGCSIDGIGTCGNYVEIDGNYVAIANWVDLGLGSMEWCGQEGVTAESAGELKDGKFFASTLVVHAHE